MVYQGICLTNYFIVIHQVSQNFLFISQTCDKAQSYIGKTKIHLVVWIQEHLSGKSGRSAIHVDISSCKDCHSCLSASLISQANTDLEAKERKLYM